MAAILYLGGQSDAIVTNWYSKQNYHGQFTKIVCSYMILGALVQNKKNRDGASGHFDFTNKCFHV